MLTSCKCLIQQKNIFFQINNSIFETEREIRQTREGEIRQTEKRVREISDRETYMRERSDRKTDSEIIQTDKREIIEGKSVPPYI